MLCNPVQDMAEDDRQGEVTKRLWEYVNFLSED